MQKANCNLFIIPARDAPKAVIIRRGPSAWYHLILWEWKHKGRDVFTHGAWIRARLFPEKCDLSPDGNLFVYFVFQGSRHGTDYKDSYTAVSRPPWLYALALWPHGGTYAGGGRFLDNHTLIGPFGPQHPDHQSRVICAESGSFECHRSACEVSDSDWSGLDFSGRVIFTKGGKVFRRKKVGRKQADIELADFNDLQPHPQPAPKWAMML
jgi:hypothetical protein